MADVVKNMEIIDQRKEDIQNELVEQVGVILAEEDELNQVNLIEADEAIEAHLDIDDGELTAQFAAIDDLIEESFIEAQKNEESN